jgi:hypothetical protein
MRVNAIHSLFLGLSLFGVCVGSRATAQSNPQTAQLEYNRDVRPILSENCFSCHGFDAQKRQAGLRLDTPEGAYRKLRSGKSAFVPGKPNASEAIQRILMKGPLHMPPASAKKELKPEQVEILRRWVVQGAHYEKHWAFTTPKRPPIPAVKNQRWPRNAIDRFILARLEKEGLKPAPEADRRTLIRRLYLDLTGLPPTLDEVRAFLKDTSPEAYEKLVDRILLSPRFGERMAVKWLDLARYADTHGYHIDSHRDMWRWRDWVIDAYNNNLPYDQFVIQQIAGDLIPNATLSQRIATGFNRNHPINFEGGAIPEEYQTAYVVDRIDTTATTFLGLTFRCAQCHDHKYDPFTMKDYYRFYAFFNTIEEVGLDGSKGNAVPFLKAPTFQQQTELDNLNRKVTESEQAVQNRRAEAEADFAAWLKEASKQSVQSATQAQGLAAHYELHGTNPKVRDRTGAQPDGIVKGNAVWAEGRIGQSLKFDGNFYVELGTQLGFDRTDKVSYGAWVQPASNAHMTILSRMDDASSVQGWDLYLAEGRVFVHLIHQWESNAIRVNTRAAIPQNQWSHLFVTYDGSSKAKGIRVYVNGKSAELDLTHDSLTQTIVTPKPALLGRRAAGAPFIGQIEDVRFYRRTLAAEEVAQMVGSDLIRPVLAVAPDKRTPEQIESLRRFYLEHQDATYASLNAELAQRRKQRDELDASIPTTMVMQEQAKPRETFMLIRGQYDQRGEKVLAGIPAVFGALPQQERADRMALARWLTEPNHPLTSRVAVNRFWEMFFGLGLVKTSEDFGTQGEWPSHPELLDWLATEFVRTGWDVKGFIRALVTSATYRQSSKVTPALLEKDPENRLLARGARQRLAAEFIRDQALFLSGLMTPTIGGPSVRPYHPPRLWEELSLDPEGKSFSAQVYVQDKGEALYRRSMYIFWKRTCPPPSLQTFDAPEREFCFVRRSTTNTPLQALILMNDPTYVEASRKFAERILAQGSSPTSRIRYAFEMATSRPPREAEVGVLLKIFNEQWAKFRSDQAAAEKLLSVGEAPRNPKLDAAELAAWTSVASVLLNLDETITKG